MAKMIEIDFSPDERTLRQFGWIALGGFGLLAALAYFEQLMFAFGLGEARVPVAAGIAGVGLLAALLGAVYPKANRPLFVGLAVLAFPIGFVLSYLILGALFFLVITPTGVVMRLLGRDPMARTFDPDATSYWTPATPARERDDYFKQFELS